MNLSNNLLLRSDSRTRGFFAGTLLAATLLLGHSAQAQSNGTWIGDNANLGSESGLWTDTTKWSAGVIANGSGFTADFNTLNITGIATTSNVITLDADRIIGNIIFGNTDTSTAGSWNVNAGNTLTLAGTTPTITVNALGSGGFARINATIAGSDGLTKDGGGLLILAGANTYTGTTTVNAGTLRLLNNNAVNGDINLNGGSLSVDSTSVTLSGNITGSGGIAKTNNGSTLTLLGNNTFSGGVSVVGNLVLGTGTNNGLGTGTLTLTNGGIRSLDNDSRTIDNVLSFGSSGFTFGATQGATDGLGDLTFTDSGTRAVGGSKTLTVTNATTVTFANNWTGNPGHNITKAGTGTLIFDGDFATGATSGFRGSITVNAGTLVLNGSRADVGNDTTERTTTVNGGLLLINGDQSGATGAVTVTAGGTIGGSGSIGGSLTLDAGADFVFSLTDTLTVGGAVSFGGFSISDLVGLDNTIANGTYTLIDGAINFANVSNVGSGFAFDLGGGKSAYFQEGSLQVVVVPEPSTFAMLLGGFGMLLGFQRSRRRK